MRIGDAIFGSVWLAAIVAAGLFAGAGAALWVVIGGSIIASFCET
jgi:hypothetical protein